MPKIVHLDTGSDLRGGQQQLLMLARGLRERGHEQLIVTLDETSLGLSARKQGFRVFALPAHDPANANGILQLRQLLRAEPFQILHAHDGKGQTISWFASLGLNGRRIAHRRVTYSPPRRLDTRFKYGFTCDRVIAISQFIRQLLIDSGVPQSKIEVIHDGVELPDEFPNAESRARVRDPMGPGSREFLVGMFGGLTPEKGQDVALNAAVILAKSTPNACLVLATRKPAMIVSPLNVRSIGFPKDFGDFFAGLDLFIIPSLAEGLGSSALLAMAYGVPVIASRVGGLPEIVEDGVTGWLIPPGSPEALAKAIAHAASNGERLREMGAKARERARLFSSNIMVEKTENLYARLSAGNHP